MKFWMRIVVEVFTVVGFAALVFAGAEAKTIYVAVSNPDMSFLSGGVAKYQGYFKDEGLSVEVLQMNANVSVAALAAGNEVRLTFENGTFQTVTITPEALARVR